ncbi:MAG: hypothetical protein HQL57_00095 [Magnetococcales bacterium]|nr:hypothetical protein [Magnetococcales bacterium]MBF0155573.1 hypothetical protein [Magnetococcales bacterium]
MRRAVQPVKNTGKTDTGRAGRLAVRVLAAVYVGGAYGLILISLIQAIILVQWLQR